MPVNAGQAPSVRIAGVEYLADLFPGSGENLFLAWTAATLATVATLRFSSRKGVLGQMLSRLTPARDVATLAATVCDTSALAGKRMGAPTDETVKCDETRPIGVDLIGGGGQGHACRAPVLAGSRTGGA